MYIEQERPTVKIFFREGPRSAALLRQIGFGLEEEGIPYEAVADSSEDEACGLAWNAARASQMEVGIGIDVGTVALHYAKLDRERPLFKTAAASDSEEIRVIGTNAGRLVKKLPLKITESIADKVVK